MTRHLPVLLFLLAGCPVIQAEEPTEGKERRRERATTEYPELALKLQNPLARIVNLPIQFDTDFGAGVDGNRTTTTVSFIPLYPAPVTKELYLISAPAIRWIDQDPGDGSGSISGFGDLTINLFFSPDRSLVKEIYWGVGPAIVFPTASHAALGTGKWSAGPTLGFFKQVKPWTFGLLANHVWSYAGDSSRPAVDASLVEPIISYTTKLSTTLRLTLEARYDWTNDKWRMPINLTVGQLLIIGKRPVNIALGVRSFALDHGVQDWGLRFKVTLPFRKAN